MERKPYIGEMVLCRPWPYGNSGSGSIRVRVTWVFGDGSVSIRGEFTDLCMSRITRGDEPGQWNWLPDPAEEQHGL